VEDRIDPAVGLVAHARLGDRVERGAPLCTVHAGERSEPRERIAARVAGAYRLAAAAPPRRPLVLERMGSEP
jgi:pyrimidine-nucleoside phosphorylase/thymidine phosphorylase